MSKKASIAILCVVCVIALFFGVCSCLPGGLEYGKYNVYNAAVNLIQCDSMFADSVVATYKVKINEETDATIQDIADAISTRLGDMYGRYFSKVSVIGDDQISVTVSKTANSENASENSILSAVTSTGKIELLNAQSYSAEAVIMTTEHMGNGKTERYTYGGESSYIASIKLTDAGKEVAETKLDTASTYYLAVDGTVSYGVRYGEDGRLQVYTSGDLESQRVIGLISSGALDATLTQLQTEDVTSVGGLVFGIVMAAIILGSWIFYIVRYKKLAFAVIVSQLLAIDVFIIFAGLAYFNLLNIASAIGIILGYGLMSTFTCLVLEKFKNYLAEKTYFSARARSFRENNKWNCIVHAIVLVVGIVLWVIPTGVTAPLGNALVYSAVLSFGATMGLNRLFTALNIGVKGGNVDEGRSK